MDKSMFESAQLMRTRLIQDARKGLLQDETLQGLMRGKFWLKLGYEKFGDYLEQELGLPQDTVNQWSARSIVSGVEPESLYIPERSGETAA